MISLTTSREDWRTGSIPELPLLRKQKFKAKKGASMAEKKTYEPLDELLDSSGMKYKVIAKKINVPYTTFYKWRINPSRIDAVSAANIAEVIGVDLTDVIFVLKNFNQKLDKLAS